MPYSYTYRTTGISTSASDSTQRKIGVNWTALKLPVVAASTSNLTLIGQQTVDGIALVAGDRVLVKDQTTATENGIYVVDYGEWPRADDFLKNGDVVTGTLVNVLSGTVNGNTFGEVTTTGTIVVGTSSIAFTMRFNPSAVTPYMLTLMNDADAATARATLGSGVTGDSLFTTTNSSNARNSASIAKTGDNSDITSLTLTSGSNMGNAASTSPTFMDWYEEGTIGQTAFGMQFDVATGASTNAVTINSRGGGVRWTRAGNVVNVTGMVQLAYENNDLAVALPYLTGVMPYAASSSSLQPYAWENSGAVTTGITSRDYRLGSTASGTRLGFFSQCSTLGIVQNSKQALDNGATASSTITLWLDLTYFT